MRWPRRWASGPRRRRSSGCFWTELSPSPVYGRGRGPLRSNGKVRVACRATKPKNTLTLPTVHVGSLPLPLRGRGAASLDLPLLTARALRSIPPHRKSAWRKENRRRSNDERARPDRHQRARGRRRRLDHQQPAGERAEPCRAQRHQIGRRCRNRGQRGQGHRADLRRAHLRCRRRHHRVRQADEGAGPSRHHRDNREQREAGDRRDPWHGLGRRPRVGTRLPVPRRRGGRQVRPSRGEARHPARGRRDAAFAARRRRADGARHDHLGRSHRREAGTRDRAHRRDCHRRPARRRHRLCRARAAREIAAPPCARPQRRARRGGCRSLQELSEHPRQAQARPRSAASLRRRGRGGGHAAFRSGPQTRARALHEAPGRRSIEGAALFLLRRARGQQDPRRARGYANQAALDRGLGIVRKNYEISASRGGMSAEDIDRRMALIKGSLSYDDIADADLVIEAIFEDMALKKETFAKLDKIAKPDAILATNTSTLDVNAIAASTKRPESVIGLHFFSPANVMRLLEIVRGAKTAKPVIASSMALAKTIRKVPVLVGVCDGFVGNRMLAQRGREAERLLIQGALPHQVDKVLTDFGFPMGPFAMGDLAGLDVGWRVRQARGTKAPIADALYEAGRLGQKTSAGYYHYEPGSRAPIPDPEVERIIVG